MSHAIARGLSHVALVSSDMHETVKFWGGTHPPARQAAPGRRMTNIGKATP